MSINNSLLKLECWDASLWSCKILDRKNLELLSWLNFHSAFCTQLFCFLLLTHRWLYACDTARGASQGSQVGFQNECQLYNKMCPDSLVSSFCTYLFMLTNQICSIVEETVFLCEVAEHWERGARQGHSKARPLYRGNRVNCVCSLSTLSQSFYFFFTNI